MTLFDIELERASREKISYLSDHGYIVSHIVKETGLPPQYLELEIYETLKERGCDIIQGY